jgi:FkbM family methyltransferase
MWAPRFSLVVMYVCLMSGDSAHTSSDGPRVLSLFMGDAQWLSCNSSECSSSLCQPVDALQLDDAMETLAASRCVDVMFHRHLDYRGQLFDICQHAPHLCISPVFHKNGSLAGVVNTLGVVPKLSGYMRVLQLAFRGVDDDARSSLQGGPRGDFKQKALQPAGCVVRCELPAAVKRFRGSRSANSAGELISITAADAIPNEGSLGMPLVVVHSLRRLFANDGLTFTVVDVGCNKGEFTHQIDELWNSASLHAFYAGVPPEALERAGVVPPDLIPTRLSVHCIEAIGTTVRELRKMQAGGFFTSAVRIHHLGISDGSADDEAEFHSLGYGDTVGTLFERQPLDGRPMVRETVRMMTLDAFAADHDISKFNILKIDTEGNDGRVLLGARELLESHRIDVLLFEYGQLWVGLANPAVFNLENAVEFLAQRGYVSYWLTESHAVRLDGACWRLEFENWPESADILAVRHDFEHHCKLVRLLNLADP